MHEINAQAAPTILREDALLALYENGSLTFNGHPVIGVEMTTQLLVRLYTRDTQNVFFIHAQIFQQVVLGREILPHETEAMALEYLKLREAVGKVVMECLLEQAAIHRDGQDLVERAINTLNAFPQRDETFSHIVCLHWYLALIRSGDDRPEAASLRNNRETSLPTAIWSYFPRALGGKHGD